MKTESQPTLNASMPVTSYELFKKCEWCYINGYNLGYHAVNGATTDLHAEFGPKRFLRNLDVFDRGIRSDQMAIFFDTNHLPKIMSLALV